MALQQALWGPHLLRPKPLARATAGAPAEGQVVVGRQGCCCAEHRAGACPWWQVLSCMPQQVSEGLRGSGLQSRLCHSKPVTGIILRLCLMRHKH